jgi:CTP synthase (UTP-ammonia lyase)
MQKGKNGQQLAAENVAQVEQWIKRCYERRDWHDYEYNNRINRRILSEKLGFSKSVCTQNRAVRELLEAVEKEWFGDYGDVSHTVHEAPRETAEEPLGLNPAFTNSHLNQRIAELEAEADELRKQLAIFKKQQDLIAKGAAGFRV